MFTLNRPFLSLTAEDIMNPNVKLIPRKMSLKGAAHLLSQSKISGAPIVDNEGRCIGVLSTTDIVRWAEDPKHGAVHTPHDMHTAWELMDVDPSPPDQVGNYMTHDPVLARPETGIVALARMMLDADIHRIIVADRKDRPIGIVTSTDILAALVQAGSTNPREVAEARTN